MKTERIFRSARFLIPFVLGTFAILIYLTWVSWDLYEDDFTGKGIPNKIKTEWLGLQEFQFLFPAILFGVLLGTAYCTQRFFRKETTAYRPYSGRRLGLIGLLALALFLLESLIVPQYRMKSRRLLTDIVYTVPGQKFQRTTSSMTHVRAEGMDLFELIREKKKQAGPTAYIGGKEERIRRIDYELAARFSVPFYLFFYYLAGVVIGALFRKTYAIFAVIFSVMFFTGTVYLKSAFIYNYHSGEIRPATAVWIPLLIFFSLSLVATLIMARKKILLNKDPGLDLDLMSP